MRPQRAFRSATAPKPERHCSKSKPKDPRDARHYLAWRAKFVSTRSTAEVGRRAESLAGVEQRPEGHSGMCSESNDRDRPCEIAWARRCAWPQPRGEAEAKGSDLGRLISLAASTGRRNTVTIDGKHPYLAAEEFARSPSDKDLRQAAENVLKYSIFERFEGVQPDVLRQEGFEATWVLRDFLQACYMMLFSDMTRTVGIRNCKFCGQFFYPTTQRPRFCSIDCARKNQQRRYWKKRGKTLRRIQQEEKKP
jgi:hypothetical protein